MIHDTHAHLDLLWQKLNDLPEMRGVGIFEQLSDIPSQYIPYSNFFDDYCFNHSIIIQPGVSTENTLFNFYVWKNEPKVKLLIGSHPEIVSKDFDVERYINNQQAALKILTDQGGFDTSIIGVGECGLDYHYTQDNGIKTLQKLLFRSQIELSLNVHLPLVIHCREAFDDLFQIIDEYPELRDNFVIHCFTEGVEILQKVVERNGYVGIGGIVTFRNAKELQESVVSCPLENILFETDLPFLAPIPHRGKVCLPEYIRFVVQETSRLKQMTEEDLWLASENNMKKLFSIGS